MSYVQLEEAVVVLAMDGFWGTLTFFFFFTKNKLFQCVCGLWDGNLSDVCLEK